MVTDVIQINTIELMESSLRRSVEQYSRIIAHAGRLEALLLHSDTDELKKYIVRMEELQEEARQHDETLNGQLAEDSHRWRDHPLYQKRISLLEKLVELNRLLLPRIHGMMAVTAHELSQIKGGRKALGGYRQSSQPTGSRARGRGVG